MTSIERANIAGAMDYAYRQFIEQMDLIVDLEARMAAMFGKPRNGVAYLPEDLQDEHGYLRGLQRGAEATMQQKYLLYKGLRAELDSIDQVKPF